MGFSLSSKAFEGSFISLIVKYGERVSLVGRVLSVVFERVDQAVTAATCDTPGGEKRTFYSQYHQ